MTHLGGQTRGVDAAQLKRQLLDVSPSMSTWPSAARRGGIMAALLALGVWADNPEAGIAATTGALNIALLDAAVSRGVLARALWLCLATTTVVGFAAAAIGSTWWLIPFLGVLAFLQGALSGAGLAVANATIANMITAILFSLTPGGLQEAASVAGWLFLGALVEVMVALLAWHWERQGLVRRQVAMALRARAARPAADPITDDVARWVAAARRTAVEAGLTRDERAAVRHLVEDVSTPGQVDPADLLAASRRLRRLPARRGDGPFSSLVATFENADDAMVAEPGTSWYRQLAALRADLMPGRPFYEAGVRLAVLMVVGAVVVRAFDVSQGHWVLLVFALAVRCDYSGTVITLIARAVGVLVGVLAVTAVVMLSAGSPVALLVVGLASGVLTCRWLLGNATLFFLFLTMFVSVLVDVWAPTTQFADERVVATLIGVAIGLAASLLWPGWRGSGAAPAGRPIVQGQ